MAQLSLPLDRRTTPTSKRGWSAIATPGAAAGDSLILRLTWADNSKTGMHGDSQETLFESIY
jgi:hypothetical protein